MQFERCRNPICQRPIRSLTDSNVKRWRRTPWSIVPTIAGRDVWALNRAINLLAQILPSEWVTVLTAMKDEQIRQIGPKNDSHEQ
jgi:hypothetical protein